MKYIVDLAGERIPVSLGPDGTTVADRAVDASLTAIEGAPVHMLRIGDRMHRVVSRRGETRGSYTLWVDGWRFEVDALDERTRTIRDLTAAAAANAGPAPLVAPMPGLVVRVLVAVGDVVTAGTPLVVMEAMKMENELRAPSDGTVSAIHATPGAPVNKGAVLVQLA
jgi:pyruvate carboxylase subunit B